MLENIDLKAIRMVGKLFYHPSIDFTSAKVIEFNHQVWNGLSWYVYA